MAKLRLINKICGFEQDKQRSGGVARVVSLIIIFGIESSRNTITERTLLLNEVKMKLHSNTNNVTGLRENDIVIAVYHLQNIFLLVNSNC